VGVAACSAVGVWVLWRVFVDTWAGQRVEAATLSGARFGQNRLWHVADAVLSVVSVGFIAVALLAAVLIAVARRRWMLAVQVAVVMAGANLTTHVVKYDVLDRPAHGVSGPALNTLPSGHTTAAASVSAVAVLVVPPRLRPWAAGLGALYTAATGVSTLVGQWHRTSDVIAGILVVLAWSALACALMAWRPDMPGRPTTRARDADPTRTEPGTATGRLALGAGASRPSSGARTGALLLGFAGLVAAVRAAFALRHSWTAVGPLTTRAELLTAYAGGVCAVLAASALGFAVLLVVRHLTTARV
jgi:membrane-associated phospholipid phosphatase